MSDIQAAIGLHQLQDAETLNARRRYLANRYCRALETMQDKLFMQEVPPYDFVHSGHLFPICLRNAEKKDNFISFLKENGISTTPYYTPLHLFSYYRDTFGYKTGDFPNAEYVGEHVICLPLYYDLKEEEQDYVVDIIGKFFG
jgi:dTDP-4-amino-4,6-dideoxygalactose transaminase